MREEFEKWYKSAGLDAYASWHDKEQRYTLFSTKQLCWEVWQAARGIT